MNKRILKERRFDVIFNHFTTREPRGAHCSQKFVEQTLKYYRCLVITSLSIVVSRIVVTPWFNVQPRVNSKTTNYLSHNSFYAKNTIYP